jgi:hypothetical protein
MEALILNAKLGGHTLLARVGVLRALNRHVEHVFDPSRKDTHWSSWRATDNSEKLLWLQLQTVGILGTLF